MDAQPPDAPGLIPPKRLGRPLNRPSNAGSYAPKFNWRGSPEGVAAKLVVYRWARSLASDDQLAHTGSWAQLGVRADAALAAVAASLPWFAGHYRDTMGKDLTGPTLLNRVYYMFRSPTGAMGPSGEHPANSPSLAPFADLAAVLFARGKPLTHAQARVLFSLPVKPVAEALAYLDTERPVPRTPLAPRARA